MENISVKIKILALAVIMLIITCLVAAVGLYSNTKSKQTVDDMYGSNLMATQYLTHADSQLLLIKDDVAYVLQQNLAQEPRNVLLTDIVDKLKGIQGDVNAVKEICHGEKIQGIINELDEHLNNTIPQVIYAAIGFVVGYVALYHWWGIQALFVGYFLHLLARVLYLTFTWRPLANRLVPATDSQH